MVHNEIEEFLKKFAAAFDIELDAQTTKTITCLFDTNRDLGISLEELKLGFHKLLKMAQKSSMSDVVAQLNLEYFAYEPTRYCQAPCTFFFIHSL